MRSPRTSHSVPSISSRSYMSSKTRHRSCSSRHSDSSQKPSRKMKFIIAIGIALPIVAAIIGVVAWAVSADTAFQGPVVSSLRRSDVNMDNPDEDIFQALEDRHDVEFSHHISSSNQIIEKHDFSRLDTVESHNQFDDTANKDPLYIVHFVPSPKPKVESSSVDSTVGSTVSNDVLQKILSASKGTKPGTPQFVVFAPVPEGGDAKAEDGAGTLAIGSQSSNSLQNKQSINREIDYDYEEELRKYQEMLDSSDNPPHKETSRVEKPENQIQSQTETNQEPVKLIAQNFTSGSIYQNLQLPTQASNSDTLQETGYNQQQLQQQILNQQQNLIPQLIANYQQNAQGYSQGLPQEASQGYSQQPVQQIQNYDQQQYQQQYFPQESNNAVQVYPPQSGATDRSGQYEPVGIRLNFGGGKGLLGGNYSPLGIIGSILRPLLPRPQLNLNGKVMFGVMLEKGVKFGNNGGHSYGR